MKAFLSGMGSAFVLFNLPMMEYQHSVGRRALAQAVLLSIGIVMILLSLDVSGQKGKRK